MKINILEKKIFYIYVYDFFFIKNNVFKMNKGNKNLKSSFDNDRY